MLTESTCPESYVSSCMSMTSSLTWSREILNSFLLHCVLPIAVTEVPINIKSFVWVFIFNVWFNTHFQVSCVWQRLGQSDAAGGDVDTIYDIIDSVESNKELTNPTYLGDSLALDDHVDDSTTSLPELVDTHDTSMASTSDHGYVDDVDVYNSSTDTASKLQTHFSLITPNYISGFGQHPVV